MNRFLDNENIYSVDMLIAYVNIFKLKPASLNLNDCESLLRLENWSIDGDNYYSPKDVLDNPEKYKDDFERIQNSELKYPIILLYNNKQFSIVDGLHRLSKACLENKKTIKAHVFNKTFLNKFKIGKITEYDKVSSYDTYYFIELFNKKFCKTNANK